MDPSPLTKAKRFFVGTYYCSLAAVQIFLAYILESCPDLKVNDIPWHPADYIAYAERINGRVAMLVLSTILLLELATGKSIWSLIHVV